jgi:Tol biopolymer transport system component
MVLARRLFPIMLIFALSIGSIHAQSNSADEPDTQAFITQNFQLQTQYTGVHCVSNDGSCPSQIEVAVPCLMSNCNNGMIMYPVDETYETIQQAADNAQAGNLILIMPGRYAGVAIEETGGADSGYIHFLGMGALGDVVIDRVADPTKSWLRHHFYFINTHHYIIQNLTFTDSSEGAGIFFSGYFSETGSFSHHMIVMNVYSHDNYKWGMHTTATSTVLIQDSVFTNSEDEHGLYVSGSGDHILIRRNIFQGNESSGVQVNADPQTAIEEIFYYLQNTTGDTCNWTEEDAEFTGSAQWEDIKQCYDQQGLPDLGDYMEDGISEDLIIEQNIITGNGKSGGAGINLASLRHSIVRNNLIYGNDAAGITCWDNAYAEEKGLASSQFGCHNVLITNNTMVDETGNRGALIINRDARDMQVYNNIIVRDRYDAYEVATNSGSGLRSSNNYYFEQYIEESPGFNGDENSMTGFTIPDALSQFMNANFEPWIIEDGNTYQLNPNRPDYHLRPDSVLVANGNTAYISRLDVFGDAHQTEIGAVVVSLDAVEDTATRTPAEDTPDTPSQLTSDGTIVYSANGQIHKIQNGEVTNLSETLNMSASGDDGFINISPDGQWLIIETTRFDDDCDGWSCWAVVDSALTTFQVIYLNGQPLHAEGAAAISSGGRTLIFEGDGGSNEIDLYAVQLDDSANGSNPVLLTGDSSYPFNRQPAISDDGERILFGCRTEPYGGDGSAICEVNISGEAFRVVIAPEDTSNGFAPASMLHHADYAPNGNIVFEGDWDGEQIWIMEANNPIPQRITATYNNDNTPCVLPNGNIVSLWLNRPEGDSLHEIKLMTPDGQQELMLLIDEDVTDIGMGCGG